MNIFQTSNAEFFPYEERSVNRKNKFRYKPKSESSFKYRIKSDLRNGFLTRYNKKFWGDNKENTFRNKTTNRFRITKQGDKTQVKVKKQKTQEVYLFEDNNMDEQMISDLENMDRWVFNNLKKMSLPVSLDKGDNKKTELDVKMLNFLIQSSQQELEGDGEKIQMSLTRAKDIQNKIAVTNETLNNEHNKAILLDLVRKKLQKHPEFDKKDENHSLMLAKMISSDLMTSFKTLHMFKHQNILKLKELLDQIGNSMRKVRESVNSTDLGEDYQYYEKTLKKHLKDTESEILSKKANATALRELIRDKKNGINSEKQRLYDFVRVLEEKESMTHKNRKVGEKMKLKEFMEINEIKSKRVKLEAGINSYIKKALSEIADTNTELEKVEKEIEDLKFKKTWFTFKLKEFYLSFLSEENELLRFGKSVVALVKGIWALEEEVLSSHFSRFYNSEDVAFVLKYSKLHNEFLEVRARNNTQKQEIKDTLRKNFDDILNEDEYAVISDFRSSLRRLKASQLKLYQKTKVRTSKKSFVVRYHPLARPVPNPPKRRSKVRPPIDLSCLSAALSHLSERLSALKEEQIQRIYTRTIRRNGRNKLLGLENSQYLKKILTLLFGKYEMQLIIQKLLKTNQIQIIPL